MGSRRTKLSAGALLTLGLLSGCGSGPAGYIGGNLDEPDYNVAALVTSDAGFVDFDCSGTLIGPRTILTAAHCIQSRDRDVLDYAFFGDSIPDRVGPHFIAIDEEIAHPMWAANNRATDVDDIALYKLSEPVEFVEPMEIYETAPTVNARLRHVAFDVRDSQIIGEQHFGYKLEMSSKVTQVQTRMQIDRALIGDCAGGSGGPGVIEKGGVEQLATIISWDIEGCDRASWHTRVDTHKDWIRMTMAEWEDSRSNTGTGRTSNSRTTTSRNAGSRSTQNPSTCQSFGGRPDDWTIVAMLFALVFVMRRGGRGRRSTSIPRR